MERIRRFIRELSEHQWLEQLQLRSWDITRAYYNVPGQYEDQGEYPEGQDFERFPSKQGTTYFLEHVWRSLLHGSKHLMGLYLKQAEKACFG